MKWLVIRNEDITMEINIIFNPYLLYDLDWTTLDPDWTAVSIIIRKKEEIIYKKMYREFLRTDEIISITDLLIQQIEGKLEHPVSMKFYEPYLEIEIHPESEKTPAFLIVLDANVRISLSREDTISLFNYLSYISGSMYSNDERLKDMQMRRIIYDEWRWFPVAILSGGIKAFVLPVKEWWHQDGEECVTIWFKPSSSWYAYEKAAPYWGELKNCKAEKVYLPKILYEANMHCYWGNTDEDYRIACRYADALNEEGLVYSAAVSRLKDL